MHILNLSISNGEGSPNALGNFFQLLITAILYVIPSLKVSKFSVLSKAQEFIQNSCFSVLSHGAVTESSLSIVFLKVYIGLFKPSVKSLFPLLVCGLPCKRHFD